MKGTLNKGKRNNLSTKKENETFRDPDSEQSSTPEISARSRESLTMFEIGKGDRMQHFGQNKEDFGMFCQNPPVTCFVIRIRK